MKYVKPKNKLARLNFAFAKNALFFHQLLTSGYGRKCFSNFAGNFKAQFCYPG